MIRLLPEAAESVHRLAADASRPDELRTRADTIRELLELAATWPVPRSARLEDDIGLLLASLCRASEAPLCRLPSCNRERSMSCAAVVS